MVSTLQTQSKGLLLSSPIGVAAAQCRDLLQECTSIPTLMRLEWAENTLAEFKLWAATTGALAGGAASLDARLITEPDTKNLVKGLLALLFQCLGKCERLALSSNEETGEVTGELDEVDIASEDDDEWWANDVQETDSAQGLDAAKDIPRGFSPWSDDTSSHPGSDSRSVAEDTSPLLEAEAEVEQIINHLARVALAIRKSGTTSRLHKADRTFDPSNHQKLRQHLELIVLARGREDGSSDYHIDREALTAIQERLILANLRRRNRYRYAQKHADKLAVDSTTTNDAGDSAAVDLLTPRQNDSAIRAPATAQIAGSKSGQTPGQEKDRLPHRNTILTVTSASGVAQAIEAVPEQTLTPSRVAKTNITTTAAKVLYPKPPQSKTLRYFKCPCCFQTLPNMYREKTLWKKHMMADICPYICILDECPTPEKLYVTRQEWAGHIEKNHQQCWQCPACSGLGRPPAIFPSLEIFLHHLRETHSQSINEQQYSTIVTEAARPIPPGICRCPLCDSTGPADSPDLLDHIAEHLHNFALRSLPWPNNGPGDNEAKDAGDSYFNADDYFDQASENDSLQDVPIDSDRDSDGLVSLSANSSHDDSVHDLPTEAALADSEEKQRMDQIRRWLSPVDPSRSLEAARAQRHEGTGASFLKSVPFANWKSGLLQFLWLDGLPGSGKTILSTTVFDHLEDVGPRCTLAFFFEFMDIEKQTFECLLRSLAWQVYRLVAASRDELESLHATCHDGATQPDISRLSDCVESMIRSSEGLSVIVNAFDQCTTKNDFLLWLEIIMLDPSCNIKFMLNGQRHPDLMKKFSGIFHCGELVTIDRWVRRDVRSYIDARLKQDTSFTVKRIPKDLRREIRTRLMDGANGTFLWATIQLNALAACQSLAAMKASLSSLPSDFMEAYSGILHGLNPYYRSDSIRLLQFIVFTNQPLTSSEAIEIMATQIDTDSPHFNVEDRLLRDEDLLQYCPSLVTITRHSPRNRDSTEVRLSHVTVKEFLLRGLPPFFPQEASIAITRTALIYIRDIDSEVTLKEASARFPLAERAARMLLDFAGRAEADDGVLSEIIAFLLDPVALDRCCRLSHMSTGDQRVSPLLFACKAGLPRATRRLLKDGIDVNEGSGTQLGALFYVSDTGDWTMVQLLLSNGADVRAGESTSWAPLLAASKKGHRDVVHLLLHDGADANAGSACSGTALQAASASGHLDVVSLLLTYGADVNAVSDISGTALQAALANGHLDVVSLLLKHGADVNAVSDLSGTALQAASANGHLDVVSLLLKHGADINAVSDIFGTALQAASANGHLSIVGLLLKCGANIAARCNVFGTALQEASKKGYLDIVELLLDKEADVNAYKDQDTSPITLASTKGHFNVVKFLIDRGAKVSECDLYEASRNGHHSVVELLLEKDPELLDHRSFSQNPALQAVLEDGHYKVVEVLQLHILCLAARNDDYDTVRELLDGGARPDKTSCLGSPLKIAADCRNVDIVRLLLERGAKVSTAAYRDNLVDYYEESGHETTKEVLDLLRKHHSNIPSRVESMNALEAFIQSLRSWNSDST